MSTLPLPLAAPPIPRDLPLPLPLPEWVLVPLLVLSFLLHLLFVNLMLGGTLVAFWAEWRGRREPAWAGLARAVGNTVTVNKSLAVVLGVAPLLSINVLYTLYFYTANVLTGTAWISVVPLVAAAFGLLYLHKYAPRALAARPGLRLVVLGLAAAVFLVVPLIFLANINLMILPERWGDIRGFWSAVVIRNVIPRYLHFLCASLSLTGLFLFGFMRRARFDFAARVPGLDRTRVLRGWYRLALFATVAQLGLGPLNLLTLPWRAMNWTVAGTFLAGAGLALLALHWMASELRGPGESLGRRFVPVVLILSFTVLVMGYGRHFYREFALAPFRKAVTQAPPPLRADRPPAPTLPPAARP